MLFTLTDSSGALTVFYGFSVYRLKGHCLKTMVEF